MRPAAGRLPAGLQLHARHERAVRTGLFGVRRGRLAAALPLRPHRVQRQPLRPAGHGLQGVRSPGHGGRQAAERAPEPRRSVLDHVLFWRAWLSLRELAWLVGALASGAFLAGLVGLWHGRNWRRLALVLVSGALLIGVTLALEVKDVHFVEHGVVVGEEVVARKGNSESFAPLEVARGGRERETEIIDRTTWRLVTGDPHDED